MNFELNWLVWIVPTFNWALQGTSEHQNREKPDPQEPPIFRPINCGSRRVLVGALMELLMEILVGTSSKGSNRASSRFSSEVFSGISDAASDHQSL